MIYSECVCVATCRWTPGAGGGKKGGCWFKVRQASQDLLFILVFAIVLTGNTLPPCSHASCVVAAAVAYILQLDRKRDNW